MTASAAIVLPSSSAAVFMMIMGGKSRDALGEDFDTSTDTRYTKWRGA